MPRTTQQIDQHVNDLQGRVAEATYRRELLALHLVESPADVATRTALADADKVLAELRSEIEVNQSARAAAVRRDGVDLRAEELTNLKAARAAAVGVSRDRAKLAAQIELLLTGKLKALLRRFGEMSADCRAEAVTVAMACMGAEFLQRSHNVISAALGETGGISGAYAAALVDAGIGSVGVTVPGLFNSHIGSSSLNMEQAALLDSDKLASRLDELIEAKEKAFARLDDAVSAATVHHLSRIDTARELVATPMEGAN